MLRLLLILIHYSLSIYQDLYCESFVQKIIAKRGLSIKVFAGTTSLVLPSNQIFLFNLILHYKAADDQAET